MKRRYEEEAIVQRDCYALVLCQLTHTYVLVKQLLLQWIGHCDLLTRLVDAMWPRCSANVGFAGRCKQRAASLEQFCSLCILGGPYDGKAWRRFDDLGFWCQRHASSSLFWCLHCSERVCTRHQQDRDSHCQDYAYSGQRCHALICHSCHPTVVTQPFQCGDCMDRDENDDEDDE